MEFSLTQVKIKSSWFHEDYSFFKKLNHKHFYLYLNLHRFCVERNGNKDVFITSLGLLRKATGYRTKDIFQLLKDLHSQSIIHVDVSRWDHLIKSKGKNVAYYDHHIIICWTLDKPVTVREYDEAKGKEIDKPVNNDFYIHISKDIFNYYVNDCREEGIRYKPDRLLPMYFMMTKYNNNRDQQFTSIHKMAEILDYDKDYLNKMIIEMNKYGLLKSVKTSGTRHKEKYVHIAATSLKAIGEFKKDLK